LCIALLSKPVTVVVLILGVVLGIAVYYLASNVQLIRTETITHTTTQQVTTIQTSLSTVISTQTLTQTSFITSTTTLILHVYPIPTNVTVAFVDPGSGYTFSYQIVAGGQTFSGSSGSPISIPISPVFAGEQLKITASVGGNCSDGNSVTIVLYIDGKQTVTAPSGCNATPAQISMTL
jgi:hypothetical protein